jgi:AGZA family xanthine/uracil permease-like MFS transporter
MSGYRWARTGDINAFFGLMLDNATVMILLVTAISTEAPLPTQEANGFIQFRAEFVLTRMIPGTALGVVLGDLVYTWMAFRLARKTGREDVTAMPLGLDTPSTFAVAFLVLLPALQYGWKYTEHNHDRAMEFAWHVGLVTLAMIGVFKIVFAPFGNLVRRLVPRAGLLGSLAGVALALISFLPLLLDGIAAVPLVGMVSLLIILITLIAHRRLPGNFPGALAAVIAGVVLYRIGIWITQEGWLPLVPSPDKPITVRGWEPSSLVALYRETGGWWKEVFEQALQKLPVILPFALATIVGGIDCTESAAAAGDEYDTSAILMTEGVASFVAGLLGGVIQTTPYIGHPAYKKMGGRAAYTLATALFIGAAGCLGGFTLLFEWLPRAAMFPILVFVGLEITAQSFQATEHRHYPALALAMLPALAAMIGIVLTQVMGQTVPAEKARDVVQTLRCLANGFIVTSLLWAAALAMILDNRLFHAAAFFGVAAVCSLFGVIHSPLAAEQINWPHAVLGLVDPNFSKAVQYQTPYHWAGAYALMVLVLVALAFWHPQRRDPENETGAHFPHGERADGLAPPVPSSGKEDRLKPELQQTEEDRLKPEL